MYMNVCLYYIRIPRASLINKHNIIQYYYNLVEIGNVRRESTNVQNLLSTHTHFYTPTYTHIHTRTHEH